MDVLLLLRCFAFQYTKTLLNCENKRVQTKLRCCGFKAFAPLVAELHLGGWRQEKSKPNSKTCSDTHSNGKILT